MGLNTRVQCDQQQPLKILFYIPSLFENMKKTKSQLPTPPHTGKNNPNWKGGKRMRNGYVWIRLPKHPRANNGYIPYHHVIMELELGRYLTKKEVVHHKNHCKTDNRLENLKLFACQADHAHQHALDRQRVMKYLIEEDRKKDVLL